MQHLLWQQTEAQFQKPRERTQALPDCHWEAWVTIAFSDKKALFTIGTTVVATRLIAGDYPNTKNIVPKVTNYLLEVNANDLMKAIERANILSIDRENIVDLSMSEDSIEISAKSSQVGSAVERIDVFKYVGQNLHISFNSGFVIEAVKAHVSKP